MTSPSSDSGPAPSRVPVSLGDRSYDILIGGGLVGAADTHIKKLLRNPRVAIITDETVADAARWAVEGLSCL